MRCVMSKQYMREGVYLGPPIRRHQRCRVFLLNDSWPGKYMTMIEIGSFVNWAVDHAEAAKMHRASRFHLHIVRRER